ncbi:MAG: beta-ketoacyl-[acyl-carrier-protein] synthase family protein [Eubacterium sp.]|nr:beta-ketoacyl-[acyl-carrier-protein] synthase family protein [Eubacterium sp.]
MKEKIVITGMGAITPIGNNVDKYWENLCNGVSGVEKIDRFDTSELAVKVAAQVKDFEPTDYMPKKLTREMDLFMQYGYAAAEEAIAQAGEKKNESGETDDATRVAEPARMGIVIGTALGGITPISETQDGLSTGEHKKVSPRFVPKIIGNEVAAQLAIAHGYRGPSLTVSTACSSGGDAIATGCMILASGQADAVLVVGAESALNPLFIKGLVSAHALSTNEDPTAASRPFDAARDGFVIGEGGGALMLETEDNAKKRGAEVIAHIAGFANCTDGYHVTSPHPDGIGAIFCMEEALKNAGIKPEEIDYINTHGTSTPVGDPIETHAIAKVFGENEEHLKSIAVTSSKGATGHMMGAGGITEVIACIQAVRTGIIPPTLNLDNVDEKCFALDFVPKKSIKKEVKYAMSNSFGFGGQNSCVIVGK